MQSSIAAFERTLQKSNAWLFDLRDSADLDSERQAYTALRAVLHVLRDRLPLEERVHLGAQMPMLIRGLYYEGWVPGRPPSKLRHSEEFLEEVENHLPLSWDIPVENVVRGVFDTLARFIDEGEIDDIRHSLPVAIRDLWDSRYLPDKG